jgi:hypothetical protein
MRPLQVIFFISILIFISCDKGLSPDLAEVKAGFGGIVTFTGEWDPKINQTHIVVFKDPLLSIEDFNVFNLNFVSESIPNGSSIYEYSTNDENSLISIIEPGVISYIAVAQSLKDTITLNREDWFVIGLYYSQSNTTNPGFLTLGEGEYLNNINILCDFNNPPIQPPGGANHFYKRSVSKNKMKEYRYE